MKFEECEGVDFYTYQELDKFEELLSLSQISEGLKRLNNVSLMVK